MSEPVRNCWIWTSDWRETYSDNGVAGGEGDDVGARDNARASFLNSGLGCVDQIHSVKCEVWQRIQLGRVGGCALYQVRCVATLQHIRRHTMSKSAAMKLNWCIIAASQIGGKIIWTLLKLETVVAFLVDAGDSSAGSNLLHYLDKAVVKGDSKEASGDGPVDIPFRLRRTVYQRLCRWTRCRVEPNLQRQLASCVCEANIHHCTQRHHHSNSCSEGPHRFWRYHFAMLVQHCTISINFGV